MSRFLGWGEVTLHRYESGGVPDRVHNDLLKMISIPDGMLRYLKELGTNLPLEEAEIVRQMIATSHKRISLKDTFEALHSVYGVSAKTGYRTINIERLRNMILFFSEGGVWKTKLNKLLWYADFVAFRRNTCSLSGIAYQRQTHGPVPFHFFTMLDVFEEEGDIQMEETLIGGYEGTMIYSTKEPDLSCFSASERDVLHFTRNYFARFNSGAISDMSHQERAWIETPQGHFIPYDYAIDLSVQ